MVIGYLLLAIALIEFILGLRFIFGYQKSQTTIWYGLFCIGASIYVGANAFGYLGNVLNGSMAERIAWIGATFLTACFLTFVMSFPIPSKPWEEMVILVLWPMAIFVPAFIATNLLVENNNLINYQAGYIRVLGSYFWFFLVYFSVYWLWSIFLLLWKIRSHAGSPFLLKFLLIGVIISLAVATYFDIILPASQDMSKFGYIGSLFTSVWLGFTSYILLKR